MIGLLATENGVVRRFALQFRLQIIIYRHKNDSQEALWCQKHAETSWIAFTALNPNCSAQDIHRGPKLVWFKQPGHKDSEYVKNIF
jgi:hypothetical protein